MFDCSEFRYNKVGNIACLPIKYPNYVMVWADKFTINRFKVAGNSQFSQKKNFLKKNYFDEYSCKIYHSFALSSYFLFYVTISAKICDNIDVGVIFVHLFLIIYFGCYGVFRL